jgi:4-amino-4-deoxy-L-arabinose transferase-like glycosyltransferase
MVESGDWLVPRFQGRPFFDKPVLSYWLMAAAFEAFGPTAFAARLVPALAALGVLGATAWLGRRLYDARAALFASVVLATTLTFVAFGRIAMSDMLLTLWTTLAVAFGARLGSSAGTPTAGGRRAAWNAMALGAVLGLGFATKGPVAWLMAGIPLALLWWRRRRQPLQAPPWALTLGLLTMLAIGGAWYVAIYLRLGGEPVAYFFLKENLERFAGDAYDVGRPFWYYPPAYLLTGLPWSLLFVPAALRARRDPISAWLASSILLALVPLSLSRGKLDYYLLPLYPAVALLLGRWLAQGSWTRFEQRWTSAALVLAALGFLALALIPQRFDPSFLPNPGPRALLVAVAIVSAAGCSWAAWRVEPARVLWALAGASAAAGIVLTAAFLPAFRAAQPNSALAEDVKRERRYRPEARMVACEDPARVERDLLFEARVAVERRCDLWDVAPSHEPYLFLLRPEEHRSLLAIPGFREVSRYRYLPAATLTLSGLIARSEPGLVVLGANYSTTDPVAEDRRKKARKRELREEWEGPVSPPPSPRRGKRGTRAPARTPS